MRKNDQASFQASFLAAFVSGCKSEAFVRKREITIWGRSSNWRYGATKESSRGEPSKKRGSASGDRPSTTRGSASGDHATNRKQTEKGGSASGDRSSTTRGSASGNNATNRKQKLVRVQFDSLQGFWEWLQPLRCVLNSSHAPLLWRQNVPCPV